LLYAAALRNALKSLAESIDGPIVVLVPGCGRGRLVQFVLDAVQALDVNRSGESDPPDAESTGVVAPDRLTAPEARAGPKRPRTSRAVRVVSVDANPIAVNHCRDRFAHDERVIIVGPIPILPEMLASDLPPELKDVCSRCHVIVSELLGSFADNEVDATHSL
jgi:hypothetical protein